MYVIRYESYSKSIHLHLFVTENFHFIFHSSIMILARIFHLTRQLFVNGTSVCRPRGTKRIFFQRNPGYLIASLTSLKFSDCCHFYDRITSLQRGRRTLKFDWRTRLAEGGYKDCALIPFSTSPFIEQHLYYRRCDLTICWEQSVILS